MPWKSEITETRPEKKQKHVEKRKEEREGERGERERKREGGKSGVWGRKYTQFLVNDNQKRPDHRHDNTRQLFIIKTK